MPAVLLNLLRPFVIWVVQIGATTVIAGIVAAFLKQIVFAIAKYYDIPEDDARVVVSNQLIDIATLLGIGTGVLASKLGVKAADYLGIKSAGAVKKALSAPAAAKVKTKDGNPANKVAAQGIMTAFLGGETIWKGILFIMLVQQVGDWFIFGRPQLQGYIDAVFGKDQINLPTASDVPAPFGRTGWDQYLTGIEQAGALGMQGGAARQSIAYSRDALSRLAWWAYSEVLKDGKNPTEANVKPLIHSHLIFSIGQGTIIPTAEGGSSSAVSPSGEAALGASSPSAVSVPQRTVSTRAIGSGTFTPPATAYIDNTEELRAQAEAAARAFLSSMSGDLILEISSATKYTDDEGNSHYAGIAEVQDGVDSRGAPKVKRYTGKFALLSVYYDVPGPGRKKLISIPLGSINATAYRPTAQELAQIASNISAGVASQVATTLAKPTVVVRTEDVQQLTSSVGAGKYQVEISDSPEGFEVIYYPPGTTPNPSLRYPGAPEPSTTRPIFVPTEATAAQLYAREHPTAFTVAIPSEQMIYRTTGDTVQGVVYQVLAGVPRIISRSSLIANTNLIDPNGILWKTGEVKPAAVEERSVRPTSPTFVGGYWRTVYDRDTWDAEHAVGSWEALPVFNRADIETVMRQTGGKLPNQTSFTLNN